MNKIVINITYDPISGSLSYMKTSSDEAIVNATKMVAINELRFIKTKIKIFVARKIALMEGKNDFKE